MRNLTLLFVFLFISTSLCSGQELNVKVIVNGDQVGTSDPAVFKDMERAVVTFLNTRKWTNDSFKNHEKINCTMFVNIRTMPSIGSFSANVQITSARPIYNSNYETVLFNFADREWDFEYIESQPLEYNDNDYMNNLTSMLAFYAYVILAMDYDSFSDLGGTQYVQRALMVVNNAQSSNRLGWAALGSNRNRYALVENLNNPQLIDLRKGTYQYHRLALDIFEKDPDKSREVVLEVLKNIQKIWTINPTAIGVISFFDAKATELVNIFSEGNLSVRRQAYDILIAIDPKRNIYQKIIAN